MRKLVMLTLVVPFLNTSGYYDLLGLNYRDGNSAKSDAIEKKLLIEHRIHTGKRGGQSVLIEPSRASFLQFGMEPQYENPGFLHRYLQHQVKVAMTARGYSVSVEKSIKGKSIDVVLESDQETIAVEIAVSDAHEVENLTKDLRVGADKVFIICLDKKVLTAVTKKIQSAFNNDILSKVTVSNLAEFIDKFS